MLGVAQRRGLGVDRVRALADVRGAQDAEPLGVGRHDPVLDAVVDHLHEVAGAVRPAVEVAVLRGAARLLAARRARDVAAARRQRRKIGSRRCTGVRLAADHHAVAALEAPDAAAGAHVDVVDPLRRELLRAADVVDVVGVAAVDEDVAGLEAGSSSARVSSTTAAGTISQMRARLRELLHEVRERAGADGLLARQLLHGLRRHVEDHALVAAAQQPPHHVRAHPSESDHAELHHAPSLSLR